MSNQFYNIIPGKFLSSSIAMNSINEAASLLLTAGNKDSIDDVLTSGLKTIGYAADVDRVHIWCVVEQKSEILELKRLYTWLSKNAQSALNIPGYIVVPARSVFEWRDRFLRGEYISSSEEALSLDEKEFFGAFNSKITFLIPLLLGEVLWGVIGIDDCVRGRTFSVDDIAVLAPLCLMVADAINRHKMILDLIDINEKAHAASKAKNTFLSNMSHEIRTPLNAIVGMAAVGMGTADAADKDNALKQINASSAHLLEIISNVLDMAVIEEGKMELNSVEFNFRDTVDKAVSHVSTAAAEKNQSLLVNIDETIPVYVIGDNLRLQQLLQNLLSNAVKFTPVYGKISLDATLMSDAFEHLKLHFTIKDNGIGISKEDMNKLFSTFEQAHGAQSRDYGGTGLGLPISKRIVELMDGNIEVQSVPNRGTVVTLTIQLAKSHKYDVISEKDGESSGTSGGGGDLITPGEFKGKRLLVVEDIEINREILITLLKDSELIIECAEDGQVAVDMIMFNAEKYDVVFMDLQMPNMGGLEATRQIREMSNRKRGRLPIIAMTANVLASDIEACLEAGMDDHLGKPLDLDKVMDMLRKYLSE